MLPLRDRVDLGAMAMKGTLHSPKLQHYWNLTIRLFSFIFRTHVGGGVLPHCRGAVGVFYSPSRLSKGYLGYAIITTTNTNWHGKPFCGTEKSRLEVRTLVYDNLCKSLGNHYFVYRNYFLLGMGNSPYAVSNEPFIRQGKSLAQKLRISSK